MSRSPSPTSSPETTKPAVLRRSQGLPVLVEKTAPMSVASGTSTRAQSPSTQRSGRRFSISPVKDLPAPSSDPGEDVALSSSNGNGQVVPIIPKFLGKFNTSPRQASLPDERDEDAESASSDSAPNSAPNSARRWGIRFRRGSTVSPRQELMRSDPAVGSESSTSPGRNSGGSGSSRRGSLTGSIERYRQGRDSRKTSAPTEESENGFSASPDNLMIKSTLRSSAQGLRSSPSLGADREGRSMEQQAVETPQPRKGSGGDPISPSLGSLLRATSPPLFEDSPSTVRALSSPRRSLALDSGAVPGLDLSEWELEHEPGMHEALITIDESGTIISCNRGAQVLFGYPIGDMLGLRVERLMPDVIGSSHQQHIDDFLRTGVSHNVIGAWRVRSAVRLDGEQFKVRVAVSLSVQPDGRRLFSSLIDPIYEATIRTDGKGNILACSGSPWLIFGLYRESLMSKHIGLVLRRPDKWLRGGDHVLVCKNLAGEEFVAQVIISKLESGELEGIFKQAPIFRVKLLVNELGVVEDVEGDLKSLLGIKKKNLQGCPISDILPETQLRLVSFDTKSVVQLNHRSGKNLFVTLRATKAKDVSGKTLYELRIKGHSKRGFEGLALKGEQLRYDGPVYGWYELGPALGHGICGPVRRAVHRLTGEEVAIKSLSRKRYTELGMQYPPPKVDFLEGIRHPNLVRIFEVVSMPEEILLVMELVDGGDMFDYLERRGALPEPMARSFWRQLLSAVDYLHRKGVVHRDIKLDNLVVDFEHNLKLIDFGFATAFSPSQRFKVFLGSPDYAAPELVEAVPYEGPSVDIWACGVVLYLLCTGFLPFPNPQRIRSMHWEWPPGNQPSQPLVKLLFSIFQPFESRATMDQILREPWGGPDIRWDPAPSSCDADPEIITDMMEHYGWSEDEIRASLIHHDRSQLSTTYHLLEYRKRKGFDAPAEPVFDASLLSQSGGGDSAKKDKCMIQ